MSVQGRLTFNRTLIAFIFLIGTFVTILNQTVLFTALPEIMVDFGISAGTGQWLTTAYLMANGILLPVTAFFIGKYTTRQLMIAAMSLFIIGTTIAAVSPNFTLLLIARIIQACGASITMLLMQTVFFIIFPKEKRGAAMGLVGFVVAFAPAIGPTLSGLIMNQFSWRYIFFMVLPVAIMVLILTLIYMKNVTEVNKRQKMDIPSVLLSTVGFGALLYGISIAGSGRALSATLWCIVGAAGLTLLILKGLRSEKPMLEFRVFKSYAFVLSTIAVVISFICLMAPQTMLPIYIQNIRGMTALESGLILLPGAIVNGVVSMVAGKIYDRIGGKFLGVIGYILIAASVIPFILMNAETALWMVGLFYALMIVGISMIMMPMTTEGLNALPDHLISHGTAMLNTFRQIGGSMGTALLIAIYTEVSSHAVESGRFSEGAQSQVYGINYAFVGVIIFAIVGLVGSSLLKSRKGKVALSSK
ncbi:MULTISPECIES: MDR family MFS transporter [Paenibacillus]|uniref:MFS-type transporter YcnB n=1 Tax=Paenibacillus albilobatus TaxID=2716884 RepID=A0A920CBI1_9BACL|nr:MULTISPECIES: MDR family MFS transporter [Paenibacillus]GIO31029.1 putative MFS-type transporter YcnB [Paenibacillus albilobatus]